MTPTLEFPYHFRGKIVFGLVTLFLIGLAGLACFGYFWMIGEASVADFTPRFVAALIIAIAFVLLIPFLLFRQQRSVLRLTGSELITGRSAAQRLPIREIQKVDVRQVDKFRVMYVVGNGQHCVMVSETMLPNALAFDQIQQALLACRTDWKQTGTVWAATAVRGK
jgi:hypothetical protein